MFYNIFTSLWFFENFDYISWFYQYKYLYLRKLNKNDYGKSKWFSIIY